MKKNLVVFLLLVVIVLSSCSMGKISSGKIELDSIDMVFDPQLSLYTTNEVIKQGNLCMLTFSIKISDVTEMQRLTIQNFLPEDVRPNTSTIVAMGDTGLGDGKAQKVTLNSDGSVDIWPVNIGKTSYAIGTITYICK